VTAVTFPKRTLRLVCAQRPARAALDHFWISNGGRHYPPWNGRHVGVMGLEEVTSYFHYGLAESVKANPLSKRGFATHLKLRARTPLHVAYIMGLAAVPVGFDRVAGDQEVRRRHPVAIGQWENGDGQSRLEFSKNAQASGRAGLTAMHAAAGADARTRCGLLEWRGDPWAGWSWVVRTESSYDSANAHFTAKVSGRCGLGGEERWPRREPRDVLAAGRESTALAARWSFSKAFQKLDAEATADLVAESGLGWHRVPGALREGRCCPNASKRTCPRWSRP